MPGKKSRRDSSQSSGQGFTAEERAAMREAVRERARPAGSKADGERDVIAKIAEMPPADRAMAQKIHDLVKAHAPGLTARTWYGMPAYSQGDRVLCFFRSSHKFKNRYAVLGFSDTAKLDEGNMWPTDFALVQLTGVEEAKIASLLKRALSR